ncbi:helix-turn-helix domain-containing protein [Natronobacterium gregoryi]|uniref:MarR family transcriptional regulator n=2 Tax=Natronobacterium gregoryi TaxID=44930 RepID=L0AM51_NATGS|nr:helix-turn-helix domain-containing protein [Natronobacterium gregoryi]AFZ74539.1 hypothetical protein Natgr_3420 [Natronobacterium gregoryi SP2]ELY72389.1 PaaX domain-containing protein [Natronobacterium gregoryi SP2]PLK21716.1 MarR family transcriptional regulator [Natronobacterium gregoryi SP2]SFI96824.1 MarR family protein [Natronobacterium gregoryi]
MPKQLPQEVRDLPPSARLIWLALEDGPMTVDELQVSTGCSKKRIRDCARELEEEGLVESQTSLRDARKSIYTRQ